MKSPASRGLPSFPLLRYLSIGLLSLQANEQTAISGFQDFFCSLIGGARQPSLEALNVRCSWDKRSFSSQVTAESSTRVQDISWDRTATILTNRALYPELRAFRFTTQVGAWSERDHFQVVYEPTADSDLEHMLGQQVRASLSAMMECGLLFDIGESEETKQGFDRAASSALKAPWGDGAALEYLLLQTPPMHSVS